MPEIFTNYQGLAMRTCKEMGSTRLNIAHMAIGLNSELHELGDAIDKNDIINIAEEIADMYWYLAGVCNQYDIILTEIISDRDEHCKLSLDMEISKLNELIKKDIIYDKFADNIALLTDLMVGAVQNTVNAITAIEATFDINLKEALLKNIEKLKVRYPDKYTDYNAVNRDLEQERKELEK